jgi:CheY-like chemotaxis protein
MLQTIAVLAPWVCFAAVLWRLYPSLQALPSAAEQVRHAGDMIAQARSVMMDLASQVERLGEIEARVGLLARHVSATETDAKPLRILVVDDVEVNRDIAAAFIRSAGHEAVCAESGAEAVEAVSEAAFDMVMMDLSMPGIDGLEAARRIRSLEGPQRRVPIVALTAEVRADHVAACRDAGMDGHLAKPFTQATLLSTLSDGREVVPELRRHSGFSSSPDGGSHETVPPVLNLPMLQRTASSLDQKAAMSHLRTVIRSSEALLEALHAPDALTIHGSALAEAAHTVGGSAGLFGFERLATVASHFEHAIQSDSPATLSLADDLSAALEVSLQQMQTQTDVPMAA